MGILLSEIERRYDMRPSTAMKVMEISEIIDSIAKAEYAYGKTEWIPTNIALPSDSMDVLCHSDFGQVIGYYTPSTKQWFAIRLCVDPIEILVDAWMPLPTPYKENCDELD